MNDNNNYNTKANETMNEYNDHLKIINETSLSKEELFTTYKALYKKADKKLNRLRKSQEFKDRVYDKIDYLSLNQSLLKKCVGILDAIIFIGGASLLGIGIKEGLVVGKVIGSLLMGLTSLMGLHMTATSRGKDGENLIDKITKRNFYETHNCMEALRNIKNDIKDRCDKLELTESNSR